MSESEWLLGFNVGLWLGIGLMIVVFAGCIVLAPARCFGYRAKSETPNRALPKGGSGTAPPRVNCAGALAERFKGILDEQARHQAEQVRIGQATLDAIREDAAGRA